MEKGFELNMAKEFFNILTDSSSSFLDLGTKFKPLLRMNFSESESKGFSGIVTTVSRLSSDESQVI